MDKKILIIITFDCNFNLFILSVTNRDILQIGDSNNTLHCKHFGI